MDPIKPDPKTPMSKGKKTALATAVAALVTPVVLHFEGTIYHTYRDPAPRAIVTACTGHTSPELRMGMTFTKEQCDAMLEMDLQKHWAGVQECINVETSENEKAAYLSFAFNVGVANFCKSSLLRKLNSGDHQGACDGLLAWVYAGNKELPGLVARRKEERRLCLGLPYNVTYNVPTMGR